MSAGENTVELLGWYGGDITHAQSAWTSTVRELTPEKLARVPALLAQLASAGHETPFEKSALHFLCTTDVASHIHALKHRIGVSLNGESARYKELREDRFYVPLDWPEDLQRRLAAHARESQALYHDAFAALEARGVPRKRAKESARFFLPYASQTTMDVQFNFRSFVHFQRLRNSPHAQVEIRTIAQRMVDLVHEIEGNPFAASLAAFGLERAVCDV
jgi:thymidylate synthase (FAD)